MSKRWFISDTHFGHANILKYQPDTRKYTSVAEMDTDIVTQWNKRVAKKDKVFVIGDFSFYRNMDKNVELLKKLNGTKILIRGNHDLGETSELIAAGFSDVRDEMFFRFPSGEQVFLKHFPYEMSAIKMAWLKVTSRLGRWKKYYAQYPIDKGMWHIHGHLHGRPKVNKRQINVNFDTWHRPVSEFEIMDIMLEAKKRSLINKISRVIKGLRKRILASLLKGLK